MSDSPDGAFDNEDSDSFHSFNNSELSDHRELSASWKSSLSSDCDSATGFESEHETSVSLEDEYSIEPQPQASKETAPNALFGISKPKSSDQVSEFSSDSSACGGVSTNNDTQPQMERFKALKKFGVSPLNTTEEPMPICPRKVPELSSKQMPSDELFDLDASQRRLKEYLDSDSKAEVKHKHAFTEIWVERQQKFNETKRSPLREFSSALDAYFSQDLADVTSKKQVDPIAKPVEKPAKVTLGPNKRVMPAEVEYVSPFKNLAMQAPPKETPLLNGAKKPTIVPAGFDLTRLVEFKNPNHWARRQHVRTGDRIY